MSDELIRSLKGENEQLRAQIEELTADPCWEANVIIAKQKKEIEKLRAALRELRTAVAFKTPPVEFNGVLCYEARVPIEFVDIADAALTGEKK